MNDLQCLSEGLVLIAELRCLCRHIEFRGVYSDGLCGQHTNYRCVLVGNQRCNGDWIDNVGF